MMLRPGPPDLPRISVIYEGHRYEVPNLDGEGVQVIQFLQRGPLHPACPGILIQDLLRIIIDRLLVLDEEKPWPLNPESVKLLQQVITHQEARALVESVKKGKVQFPDLMRVGPDGHLDWNRLL